VTVSHPGNWCAVIALLFGLATAQPGLAQSPGDDRGSEDHQAAGSSEEYARVTIGDQVWMAENLRVTRYRDGTPIPLVADDEAWSQLSTGAYCRPPLGSSEHGAALGLLYNFYAVADPRGLCPEGWHVPTAQEWHALIDHLGGPEVAGAKLKDTLPGRWKIEVPGTSNASGFSALPAGGRGRLGGFAEVGTYATWWSSTPHDATFSWHWGLHPDSHAIRFNPGHNASGFSVRCVLDDPASAATSP